jgi:hypothetical protein
MTNTATTTTEHDTFCDCQACLDRLVADLNTLNAGRAAPKLDDFDDQPVEQAEHQACLRCGRALRSEKSRSLGYGPTCARKIRHAEATSDAKPEQLAKAVEAIETGAVVPVPRRHGVRVFRVVSSHGDRAYLTTPAGHCTCTAGLHGRKCFHVLATQLIAA